MEPHRWNDGNDFYDQVDYKENAMVKRIREYLGGLEPGTLFIRVMIVSLLVGLVNMWIYDQMNRGFTLEGTTFTYKESSEEGWIFVDSEGEVLEAFNERNDGYRRPFRQDDMLYKDDHYAMEVGSNTGTTYYTLNGEVVDTVEFITISFGNTEAGISYTQALFIEVDSVVDHVENYPWFLMILGVLFFSVLGGLQICYPKALWEIEHFLSTWGGEPTGYYLFMARLSGIILLIVGALIPFGLFLR